MAHPDRWRSEVLYIKLTPAEKELVDAADEEPTVWAREVVLRAARRKSGRAS